MSALNLTAALKSADDLISRIESSTPKNRGEILTELYKTGKHFRDLATELDGKVTSLSQQLSDLLAVNRELRNESKAQQATASEILQEAAVNKYKLSEAESKLQSLLSENQQPPTILSPRSELYRIDRKFTGEDRTLYQAFQKEIRIALRRNADRYDSLQSQIGLIYQNLGLGPKSFLDRYLLDDGNFSFQSLSEVWNVLDVSFRNPNEEEDARDALSRLKQGGRPFGAYLSEFQRLQNLSSIIDDKTLIAFMRTGVSSDLSMCIGQQQEISKKYTFDEYVALCKECVIRLEWMRPNAHSRGLIPNYLTPRGTNLIPRETKPLPSASSEARGTPVAVAGNPNLIPLGGDPMVLDQSDLSHIGLYGHITPEERQRRFRLNLCMRCGKPGHRVGSCRTGKKQKSLHQLELENIDGNSDLEFEELKE